MPRVKASPRFDQRFLAAFSYAFLFNLMEDAQSLPPSASLLYSSAVLPWPEQGSRQPAWSNEVLALGRLCRE